MLIAVTIIIIKSIIADGYIFINISWISHRIMFIMSHIRVRCADFVVEDRKVYCTDAIGGKSQIIQAWLDTIHITRIKIVMIISNSFVILPFIFSIFLIPDIMFVVNPA